MIRWRRKSDGFEWHKHVRTTIRIRREHRRQRIDEARQLALEGVKGAGRAGIEAGSSGLSFVRRLGRSAGHALQSGFRRVAAALPVAWERVQFVLMAGLGAAWRIARQLSVTGAMALVRISKEAAEITARGLSALSAVLGRLLVYACGPIQRRGVQPLLVLVGVVATAAAAVRLVSVGLSADAVLTLMIGLTSLLIAALPRLLGVEIACRDDVAIVPARPAWRPGKLQVSRRSLPLPSTRAAGFAAAIVIAAVAVLGGGWVLWQGAIQLASATASTSLFSRTVAGRAEAVAGDILRIDATEIRLEGIEAPEPLQRCSIPGNRRWRCGAAARIALAKSLRGQTVTCQVSGTDETGRALGTCLADDQDLARDLVRAGLAFAETGLFAKYGSDEEQAREARAGVWRGKAERPSEYRARIEKEMAAAWHTAKSRAPGGCPIKGHIVSGRKYYVLPGTIDYQRIRIRTRRGERWFCSEDEALAAGWKRSPRS